MYSTSIDYFHSESLLASYQDLGFQGLQMSNFPWVYIQWSSTIDAIGNNAGVMWIGKDVGYKGTNEQDTKIWGSQGCKLEELMTIRSHYKDMY